MSERPTPRINWEEELSATLRDGASSDPQRESDRKLLAMDMVINVCRDVQTRRRQEGKEPSKVTAYLSNVVVSVGDDDVVHVLWPDELRTRIGYLELSTFFKRFQEIAYYTYGISCKVQIGNPTVILSMKHEWLM